MLHILILYVFHLDENLRKQTCDPFLGGVCHLVEETTIDRQYLYYFMNRYEVTIYFTPWTVFSLLSVPPSPLATTVHHISCCLKMNTNISVSRHISYPYIAQPLHTCTRLLLFIFDVFSFIWLGIIIASVSAFFLFILGTKNHELLPFMLVVFRCILEPTQFLIMFMSIPLVQIYRIKLYFFYCTLGSKFSS